MLLLLVTALGGTWVVEQPGSSLLEFYPSFRYVLACMVRAREDPGAVGCPVATRGFFLFRVSLPLRSCPLCSACWQQQWKPESRRGCFNQ